MELNAMKHQLSNFGNFGTLSVNIALLLYIPGFAGPYWLLKNSFPAAKSGVWSTCAEELVIDDESENNGTYQFVCYDTNDYINDDWNSTWIPGLRAMTTLGLVTLLAAAIVADVYACMANRTFNNGMVFASMCSSTAAWFFTITGVLIHGIRRYDDVFTGYHLSWGFGLCCTSSCLAFVSAALFFAEVARLNSISIEKKLGVPGGILIRKPRKIKPNNTEDEKPTTANNNETTVDDTVSDDTKADKEDDYENIDNNSTPTSE